MSLPGVSPSVGTNVLHHRSCLIAFQNIVPISLYISIEAVRTCQALFIYFDREIFYEKTGQATLARSWNLSDDLGQIEYIFSDKTGTLTQNAMVFRQCSIGGREYKGDPETPGDVEPVKEDPFLVQKQRLSGDSATQSGSNSASGSRSPGSPFSFPGDEESPHPASASSTITAGVESWVMDD